MKNWRRLLACLVILALLAPGFGAVAEALPQDAVVSAAIEDSVAEAGEIELDDLESLFVEPGLETVEEIEIELPGEEGPAGEPAEAALYYARVTSGPAAIVDGSGAAIGEIAADSVVLVTDGASGAVAFATRNGVVEGFVASGTLEALEGEALEAWYGAMVLRESLTPYAGNLDYPLPVTELLTTGSEPEDTEESEAAAEPEDIEEAEAATEPEDAEAGEAATEPEDAEAGEAVTEPEDIEAGEAVTEDAEAGEAAAEDGEAGEAAAEDGEAGDEAGEAVANASAPSVTAAWIDVSPITAGTDHVFTVKTETRASSVNMYAEGGALVKTWKASGNSSLSDNVRVWTLHYTIGTAGSRTLTFRASADGSSYGAGKSVSVKVMPKTISAAVDASPFTAGTQHVYTVKTDAAATHLRMYAEGGAAVRTWTAGGNSSVSGSTRTWRIGYAIGGAGNRTLTFRASMDGSSFGAGKSVSVKVMPRTTSATVDASPFTAGTQHVYTVKTDAAATHLRMYAESGAAVRTWTASGNSSVSGSTRTWWVSYAIGGAGNRTLTFKASMDGSSFGLGKSVSVKVMPRTTSAAVDATPFTAGTQHVYTVKTDAAATHLRMYAEGGAAVRTWTASGNSSVSGSVRTWRVSYAISGAGNRTLTFKASADGSNFGLGKSVSVKVMPRTISAAIDQNPIAAGSQHVYTVKTDAAATHLRMYAESGAAVRTWTASGNSSVSGSTRTWRVSYAVSGAGNRTLTFKASADGSNFGLGKSVTVRVQAAGLPEIFDWNQEWDRVFVKQSVGFTIITSVEAKYLSMYSESGSKVKTWNASGYSEVETDDYWEEDFGASSVRVWYIDYAFSGSGNRTLTFKASADGSSYGAGIKIYLEVLPLPAIQTLSVPSQATVGQAVTISLQTHFDANYITMYDENGSKVKTWYWDDDGVTFTGDDDCITGQWTFQYTFRSAGSRRVSFRASVDDINYGAAKEVSISVTGSGGSTGTATYRALCIGQSTYNNPDDSSDYYWPDLEICPEDANAVAATLRGIREQYTTTVRYNRTASQILSDISSAFSGAKSGDVSLFYYSGHGFGEEEPYSDRLTYQGALVGVNSVCEPRSDVVTIAQLANALSKIPGKVIVVIDACFSGAAISTKSAKGAVDLERINRSIVDAFSGYTLDYDLNDPNPIFSNSGELATNKFIVVTASSYYQPSLADGLTPLSLFTTEWLLGAGMKISGTTASYGGSGMPADTNNDKKVTLKESFTYTRQHVNDICESYGETQTVTYWGTDSEVLFSR